jgi:hypothetical protein
MGRNRRTGYDPRSSLENSLGINPYPGVDVVLVNQVTIGYFVKDWCPEKTIPIQRPVFQFKSHRKSPKTSTLPKR